MSDLKFATPFERLIARIIDKVVITLPVYLWFGIGNNRQYVEAIGGGVLLVCAVLLNCLWDGQTVGKRVMKIRITSATGNKLTVLHYLCREFILTLYPVYLLTHPVVRTLWMFWMLSTILLVMVYGRGIHDFGVKTIVVKAVSTDQAQIPATRNLS